jgi:Flp pilus assembly protein TadD
MRAVVLAVWVCAFTLRCLYLWQISDTPFFDLRLGDADAYHEWARRIAAGDWLGDGVFYQAPLYPYFLAVLYRTIGDGVLAVRLVQALLGATSCALLAAAGVSLFGRTGAIAGLLLAIYPPAIYFDAMLDKASLMTSLTTALLALLVTRDPSTRRPALRSFAAGVVLGLLTLTRENALLLAIPAVVWFARGSFKSARSEARVLQDGNAVRTRGLTVGRGLRTPPVLVIAGTLIILLPVGVRNLIRGGEFQLTTAQLGPNLYIGNHRGASGTYEPLVVGHGSAADERDDATRLAEEASGRQLTAREVSHFWTTRALTEIRAEPWAAIALFARKLAMTFNAAEISDTETQEVYAESSGLLRALRLFDFGVLLGLATFGAVVTRHDWRRLSILYALAATYALTVATFYVLARYRFPLVPILMLCAAGGPSAFVASSIRLRAKRAGGLAVVGIAAGVLAIAAARTTIADERGARAAHYAGIATALAKDPSRVDEARRFYERALAEAPGHPATAFAYATLLTRTGRGREAIPYYRTTLASWPGHAETHFNLGVALKAGGQSQEAADHFSEAVRLRPDDADAHLALARTLVDLDRAVEAVRHYETALAINPNDAAAENDLGTTLANSGRIADALPHFERAAALDHTNERARQNLEQAKRSLKE